MITIEIKKYDHSYKVYAVNDDCVQRAFDDPKFIYSGPSWEASKLEHLKNLTIGEIINSTAGFKK